MVKYTYLETLKNLYALRKYVDTLEMVYHTKKSITDRVDFEVKIIESQVFRELGKIEFEKMKIK